MHGAPGAVSGSCARAESEGVLRRTTGWAVRIFVTERAAPKKAWPSKQCRIRGNKHVSRWSTSFTCIAFYFICTCSIYILFSVRARPRLHCWLQRVLLVVHSLIIFLGNSLYLVVIVIFLNLRPNPYFHLFIKRKYNYTKSYQQPAGNFWGKLLEAYSSQ